jgi:hypothetical protein
LLYTWVIFINITRLETSEVFSYVAIEFCIQGEAMFANSVSDNELRSSLAAEVKETSDLHSTQYFLHYFKFDIWYIALS